MLHNGSIYLDKYTTNSATIFSTLVKSSEYPKSSQPNEKFIEKTFNFLLNHYDEIIGITISSKMSGTFEKMDKAAKKLSTKGKRISIIDSCLNSGAEGLLAKNAMDMIKEGKSFDEIVKRLYELKSMINIYVKIPDLNYAVKSGRVPKTAGKLAAYIGIKPMISIDKEGNGTVLKEFNINKLISREKKEENIIEYVIVHTDNIQKAEELAVYAEKIFGFPPVYIESVSSIISAFIGKGAYGIALRRGE
jgi:DegV family protein with EDD domain